MLTKCIPLVMKFGGVLAAGLLFVRPHNYLGQNRNGLFANSFFSQIP